MKKLIVGLVALGALIGLRPVSKRLGQKAREHCEQMAEHCKEMMAGQSGARGEATRPMPEHCKEMADQAEGHGETLAAA